jgi:hypothetical protein
MTGSSSMDQDDLEPETPATDTLLDPQVDDLLLARDIKLPPRARALERELRGVLRKASDLRVLRTPPQEILQLVKILPEPPPNVAEQLRDQKLLDNAYCIVGGDKNQARDRGLRHFTRDDDAWFDFTITVREEGRQLTLLAYDFEIRFPAEGGAPFLRFDLNLPGHHNELRSHMHPGSDDIILPWRRMSPTEALTMLVHDLRRATNRPKPRGPTAFEVDWFRETHAVLASQRPETVTSAP